MWEEITKKNAIVKLRSENLNQIAKSFYKTNNNNILKRVGNQESWNCELRKDKALWDLGTKIGNSSNIATLIHFLTLYNDKIR